MELLLERMTWEADGVVSLDFVDPAAGDVPTWTPGAHIDLVLRPGLVRQYSLCGDPADRRRLRVAVLREPSGRGGSAHVHDALRVGTTREVRGPRNRFSLEEAPAYLFVAGGIGITPILPMVAEAAARGADWHLVYGGRARRSMAFADELRGRFGERVAILPQDEHGLLDLAGHLSSAPTEALVYCCGPEPLIVAMEAACPQGRLRTERFKAPEPTPGAATGGAFLVELTVSGLELEVGASESVLDRVLAAGVDVPNDCREGICGSCETRVLDGVPDHRDHTLTAKERAAGEVMMLCVSRSCSDRLVLAL